ncbi:MAG: alanine racemase [Legionellaceae bacterium]|nr:alanine racemase [Legionellaceae bacterium]
MSRPTCLYVDSDALLHNVNIIKQHVKDKKIIAMVKANAYGCGLSSVLPVIEKQVYAFGVACIEEAIEVRKLSHNCECILFQGIFSPEELQTVARLQLQCVIHQKIQLDWILATPMPSKLKIWVKVDTGMHRLGFAIEEVIDVIQALTNCPWVESNIGLMTHLACADEPHAKKNKDQLAQFNAITIQHVDITRSIANSAAILTLPKAHADVVRPGIMLYGVSPFANQTGHELGLQPVMQFMSEVTSIHHYPAYESVGYGSTWRSEKPSVIGIVPVGYGDGYPRHIGLNTPTYVAGHIAPIVGRVSMDMLTIDLTDCPNVKLNDQVELWGKHIPVEVVAQAAGTIPYELLCQVSRRVIRK